MASITNEVEQNVNQFSSGLNNIISQFGGKDTWWYPKPENQKGNFWIGNGTSQEQLDTIGLIANLCLIQCIVALIPFLLGAIVGCCFETGKDSKSGVAGGVSTLMAIGTGAVGITAVVINSVEALAGMMVLAALFLVSSVFFLIFMLLNCATTFVCNCGQVLCCKFGSAICDNIWLFIFFVIGLGWIALVVIFDVILLREAWPFVFDRASDAATGAFDDAIDGATNSLTDAVKNSIGDGINDALDT
jgi:hypothetical protein